MREGERTRNEQRLRAIQDARRATAGVRSDVHGEAGGGGGVAGGAAARPEPCVGAGAVRELAMQLSGVDHRFKLQQEKDCHTADGDAARRAHGSDHRRIAVGTDKTRTTPDSGDGTGWPAPDPHVVALLAGHDLPLLQVPRHRPGELTYLQTKLLELDMAEVPDDAEVGMNFQLDMAEVLDGDRKGVDF
eukprot:350630-Chlamydomonas_euryale.AAC.3